MCTQARSGPVSLFRFWIGGPHASLPRHIPGTDQPLTLTPPDSESPLAAESVPIDASGLYKIAHSVDGNAVLEKEIRPLRNSNKDGPRRRCSDRAGPRRQGPLPTE